MKKIFLLFISLSFFTYGCDNQPESDNEKTVESVKKEGELGIKDKILNPISAQGTDTSKLAKFQFESMDYDFGDIKEGESVYHDYSFVNIGNVPLQINDTKTTCGCTVPEYPKKPINPGEKGTIKIKFNSKGKNGYQSKEIKIIANTYPKSTTVLRLTGKVTK